SDEVGRELGGPITASLRPAILDDEVATLGPAEFAQPLQKSSDPTALGCGHRYRAQEPDGGQLSRLLRARRYWPRCRPEAECDQQFPPSDGDCHTPLPREVRKENDTTPRACSLAVSRRQDAGCCRRAAGRKRKGSVFRFAPESGQSNLLRAVQDHGLRRENDKAYAPSRMSIKGSSDSSIPSVSWPGRKSNFFSASALSGTTLSTVKTPSSATLRSSGQATEGSLVDSPAAASCAFR